MPDITPTKTKPEKTNSPDSDILEARKILDLAWAELKNEKGEGKLCFPKKICWLNGAPGAGKGTQTDAIMQISNLTAPPIVTSSLFRSTKSKRLINAGILVGDNETFKLLLRKLINPKYKAGALVDGFPRSMVQAECLKDLHRRLMELHNMHLGSPDESNFPIPDFHIIVLYVNEATSVQRQLNRGKQMLDHNKKIEKLGAGTLQEPRITDLSETTARHRYRTFKQTTNKPLKALQNVFPYHFIDAHGSIEEVRDCIDEKLN